MNSPILLTLLWLGKLSLIFPFFSSTIKANTKENKGKFPLPLKIMSISIVLALLLQLYINILDFLRLDYTFLIHIYVVEEFVMDMLFYRELLKKTHPFKDQPTKRSIFLVAIVLFVGFAVINALFISGINKFPMYTSIIQCIVMIICTNSYNYTRSFYEPTPVITTEVTPFKLYKGPVFWMNTGKSIYFNSSLLIFIIYNMLFESGAKDMALLTWRMQDVFLIILHIFMGIGFLKFKANPNDVLDMQGHIKKVDDASKRG